jgi:hypothetical protein
MRFRLDAPDMTRGVRPQQPTRAGLRDMILRCYSDAPALWLTSAQVGRLLNVRPDACEDVLEDLVQEGRLRRDGSGQYVPPSWLWSDGTRV